MRQLFKFCRNWLKKLNSEYRPIVKDAEKELKRIAQGSDSAQRQDPVQSFSAAEWLRNLEEELYVLDGLLKDKLEFNIESFDGNRSMNELQQKFTTSGEKNKADSDKQRGGHDTGPRINSAESDNSQQQRKKYDGPPCANIFCDNKTSHPTENCFAYKGKREGQYPWWMSDEHKAIWEKKRQAAKARDLESNKGVENNSASTEGERTGSDGAVSDASKWFKNATPKARNAWVKEMKEWQQSAK